MVVSCFIASSLIFRIYLTSYRGGFVSLRRDGPGIDVFGCRTGASNFTTILPTPSMKRLGSEATPGEFLLHRKKKRFFRPEKTADGDGSASSVHHTWHTRGHTNRAHARRNASVHPSNLESAAGYAMAKQRGARCTSDPCTLVHAFFASSSVDAWLQPSPTPSSRPRGRWGGAALSPPQREAEIAPQHQTPRNVRSTSCYGGGRAEADSSMLACQILDR